MAKRPLRGDFRSRTDGSSAIVVAGPGDGSRLQGRPFVRRTLSGIGHGCAGIGAYAAVALLLAGCSTVSRHATQARTTPLEAVAAPADPAVVDETTAPTTSSSTQTPYIVPMRLYAQTESAIDAAEVEQYDPWESFNEAMFNFNLKLDKYVLKPVANVYRHVIPEPFQVLIANGFDNIRWVPRFVNNLLQGKFEGAGREMARFLINSTAGIGGLFDPAKDYWGIRA